VKGVVFDSLTFGSILLD